MAEIKSLLWVSNILGIPITAFAFFLYIETWKGNIIFALSVVYLVAKIWFYIQKNIRDMKMKDLDIEEKANEIESDDSKNKSL